MFGGRGLVSGMGRIAEESIQQVIATVNIVDVVSSYFPLKRSGGAYMACCPFHAEKSASFNIGGGNAFRGRMHCFGCGWDGDVIAFWMQVKGCDFKQALMDLAREAGVSVGEGIDYGPRTERPVASALISAVVPSATMRPCRTSTIRSA